jgi:hypothetical protein
MDPKLGLVRLTDRTYGYMQKDEGLGWTNGHLQESRCRRKIRSM